MLPHENVWKQPMENIPRGSRLQVKINRANFPKKERERKGKDGLPKHPILQGLLLLVHLFDFFDHSRCLYNDRMKEDSGGVPTYGRWLLGFLA